MIFKGGYINNSDSVRFHKIKNININCNELYISIISSIFITVNNNTIYTITLTDLFDTRDDNTILIETKIFNNYQLGLFVNNKNIYSSPKLFEYELKINIDSNIDSNKKDIITYSDGFIYDS